MRIPADFFPGRLGHLGPHFALSALFFSPGSLPGKGPKPTKRIDVAEDRQQLIQPSLHPPKVADVAPADGIGVVTEVVIGELLHSFQLGVDDGGTGEVGVESGLRSPRAPGGD